MVLPKGSGTFCHEFRHQIAKGGAAMGFWDIVLIGCAGIVMLSPSIVMVAVILDDARDRARDRKYHDDRFQDR